MSAPGKFDDDLFNDYVGRKVQVFRRPKGSVAPFKIVCECGYSILAMPFWAGKFPCAFCGAVLLISDDD